MTSLVHGEFVQSKLVDMNKLRSSLFSFLIILQVFCAICCKSKGQSHAVGVNSKAEESDTIESLSGSFSVDADTGLKLYGSYSFDSGGGSLSSIYRDNVEVVPLGASLKVIGPNYIIGYYEGAGFIRQDGGEVRFQGIFFSIDKDGNFEFGLPYEKDPRVMGESISGEVFFDAYNGKND